MQKKASCALSDCCFSSFIPYFLLSTNYHLLPVILSDRFLNDNDYRYS